MSKKIKEQVEGITLIALVVTIIILLILSGVAINLSIGSNGIFIRVQESVEEYNKKQKEEEVNMYWGEAQLNYKDTIEKQVEYLQDKMRKQDPSATAIINEGVIDVTYKGYDIKLSYIEEKIPQGIKYLYSTGNIVDDQEKILNFYVTSEYKMYAEVDGKTTCITDIYQELKDEKTFTILGNGNESDKEYILFFTKKKVYTLWISETEEWTLEKTIDIENLAEGKYKEKNISYFLPLVDKENGTIFFEDGTMYNIETKQEVSLENKIINFGVIMENENTQIVLIDSNGQMNKMTENGLESINETFQNGFFKDKKVTIAMPISNKYITIVTNDGIAYLIDINTNNMTCISDLNEELKEKKVTNIFNIGNGNFQEDYIAIILEGDKAYYATQNLQELINININGFPELHLKMS